MPTKPPRRWYQFSIRTMFVGVTLVSIPLAWVGYSLNWIRERREIENWYRKVETEPFRTNTEIWAVSHSKTPPGMLWLFGEEGVDVVVLLPGSPLSPDDLMRLFPEAEIMDRREE